MTADLKHLLAVERWTWILAALLLGPVLYLGGPRWQFGAALGALLMIGNVAVLRLLAGRLFQLLTADHPSLARILLWSTLKLWGLGGIIYLCIHYLPLSPPAFVLGMSVLPAAIVCLAIECAIRGAGEPEGRAQPCAPHGES